MTGALDLAALDEITAAVQSGAGLPTVVRAAARANAQPADLGVRDPQLDGLDAVGLAEQRLLVGRRAGGDREGLGPVK